jgi:PleD family two-component response regulator
LSEEEPLPDGDYLMFRSKLEMPGQEMNYLDVLIPVALGNLFDPQPVAAEADAGTDLETETGGGEGIKADDEEASETASAVASGVDSIVVLEDDEEQRKQMIKLVLFTGFEVAEGSLNADIKELFAGRNVKLVIISSQDADDRGLAVCIKVNAMRQDFPPPIIMSAECWTRTAVLKALKYGARDIIIKPFNGDDVTSKVRRYCKIAPV